MPDKIIIYVAPLAGAWSVMVDGAYVVNPTNKQDAQRAAEEEAEKLRAEGHDVEIRETDGKPGGR